MRSQMRVPVAQHVARPWRIREVAGDFHVEDVWALPAGGARDEFADLVGLMTGGNDLLAHAPLPVRLVWEARDRLGGLLRLGRISTSPGAAHGGDEPIPGTTLRSLSERLPADLRGSVDDLAFTSVPFTPLFRTDDEFAAELSNRTVHAVMHLGWVADGDHHYHGEMAVYVKPRGALGTAYMALIRPFRYALIYPALLRQIERAWAERTPRVPATTAGAR